MATPVASDLKMYPGASGTPTDDVSAYGGAITTTSVLNDALINVVLDSIYQGITDVTYNAIFYFKATNTTSGSLSNARVYNRAGAVVNAASGSCQYVSTSSSDTGAILTTGKVAGIYTTDLVVLTGTTPVSGTKVWDASTIIRHESLNAGGTSAVKPTGNITISSSSQILAVLYGTSASPSGQDLATTWGSAEFTLALASAKNATISGTDRLTAPASGIGSYSTATFWSGADASIPVPSGSLAFDEYIGVAVQFTAYAGVNLPVSNEINFLPILTGTPA